MRQPLSPDKGTYVLIMRCNKYGRISIGRFGQLALQPGFYIYVGSAQGPGGIRARVSRHRSRRKKLHWHIDYLRRHTALVETWTLSDPANREHDWAAALAMQYKCAHERFGASDCRCLTHLFYSVGRPSSIAIDARRIDPDARLDVKTFSV